MVRSMTGFGQSTQEEGGLRVTVEIKSLNSKTLDLSVRLPRLLNDKEIEIRNKVSEQLERGKISVNIDIQHSANLSVNTSVNKELLKVYYSMLKDAAEYVDVDSPDLFRMAMQMDGVLTNPPAPESHEAEWKMTQAALLQALQQCDGFRQDEGKSIRKDLMDRINSIEQGLTSIVSYDPERLAYQHKRLHDFVQQYKTEVTVDPARFEQEVLFYLDKLDINEEKVRLKTHLDYFKETIASDGSPGKKLNFISQEIGREINTIGSKANDSAIQKHVVLMKEELEKIKEQLNNML